MLTWGGVTPAFSAVKIGVVLMHGKTGTAKPKSFIGPLIAKLKEAGILVEAPDMSWSRSRYLAKFYEESMAEIDAAVGRLKKRGATKIVVGGHSMGANAALGYGARREGLAGIIAIAPGHVPDLKVFQKTIKYEYRRTKAMVDKGEGDKVARFADNNQGKKRMVRMKARIYLSWFDPNGPAVIPKNAANLKPGTALLWVVGKRDQMARHGRA
jgi:esterase/lipase